MFVKITAKRQVTFPARVLEADAGCGLLDRQVADDCRPAELTTLTLDRKMAALPQARRL